MNSSLNSGKEVRSAILRGAEKGAMPVIATLGPSGRNVAIRRQPIQKDGKPFHIPPLVTKDGVTVINNIHAFSDPWEDIGLQMLKEAARNTNRTGDGTTTATLLAYEMMKGGAALLDEGANAIHVKRGMDAACEHVCKKLHEMAKKVESLEDLKAVTTISSQDSLIGEVVAKAVQEVGKDGAITMQMGAQSQTYYDICSGMQIPVGYASYHFAKNSHATLRDPFIIVTTEKIVSIRDLSGILQKIRDQLDANPESKDSPIRLAIFSTGVHGDALSTLAKNNVENPDQIQCLVLNPPHFGVRQREVLEDIAICTGAKLIDRTAGRTIQDMRIVDLGTCGSILASDSMTTIVGAHGVDRDIQSRIKNIQEKLDKEEDEGNKDYLKSRLAGLNGKIANIYIGGSSQVEQREKLHRVEDAIAAGKAAYESGILPGGGVAFLRCYNSEVPKELHVDPGSELDGYAVVMNALDKQLWWVAKNAGEDPKNIIERVMVMETYHGFNAETHMYGDMMKMKVIDPAKVPISAIKNAVSVAGMYLTLEAGIDNPST